MKSFDFFNELLNRVEDLQKSVNKLRSLIRQHVEDLQRT